MTNPTIEPAVDLPFNVDEAADNKTPYLALKYKPKKKSITTAIC